MCVCVCVCVYIYIYIYIHTYTESYTLKVFAVDYFENSLPTKLHGVTLQNFIFLIILFDSTFHSLTHFPNLPYDMSIPLLKLLLHTVPPMPPSFNLLLYSVLYLRSFSSCLLRLPLLPVTSALPSMFHSVTCFRRQFLHEL